MIVFFSRRRDRRELVLQLGAGQRVEGGERLVEQEDLGLHRQRPGNRDALAHAAGKLRRSPVDGVAERPTMSMYLCVMAPRAAGAGFLRALH